MKVVLFCGGFGTRLREYSETIPKPLVEIGYRPILWHVMKYYAHYGHTDFVLCLGWKADAFKQYFLEYDECASNDFVLSFNGDGVELLNRDTLDWRITFCDTGTTSCIGERLRAVRHHLEGEETFLANYTDGLADVHLPDVVDFHRQRDAAATFLAVKPSQSFHIVSVEENGHVGDIRSVMDTNTWINGGFFVLNQSIFDVLHEGEELVNEPFHRLTEQQRLCAYKHEGFFACMDTFKEKQLLDDMYARGETPWEVWQRADRPGRDAVEYGLLDQAESLSREIRESRGTAEPHTVHH